MITEFDKQKYPLPTQERPRTIIDKADESVDIRDILKKMNVWAPEGDFYSYKINCPWNHEHSDGGLDKNCRIFGGSNIYCWAMHGYITPTVLYSKWKSVSRTQAAEILLEERGLLNKPWWVKWVELIDAREEPNSNLGSKAELVSSIHEALKTDPIYIKQEFSQEVRDTWQHVLSVLDQVWEHPNTDLIVLTQWFNKGLERIATSAKLAEAKHG